MSAKPITGSGMRGVVESDHMGTPLLTVQDPNALTQVLGWLKFSTAGQVLFRGQAELHADMLATGLRGKGENGRGTLSRDLRVAVDGLFGSTCTCGPNSKHRKFGQEHQCVEVLKRKADLSYAPHCLVSGTYRAAVEPLLQHYGVETRWLDVVDNVWIALWFACHRQITEGRYAFHLRRSVAQEGDDAKSYIAVMRTGETASTQVPGYSVGAETRVVDLRDAVPSVFLRPHAQHGLLMAPASLPVGSSGSLLSQVVAYIEVSLGDSVDWLGSGAMLSAFVLFPPAALDVGYQRLIEADDLVPAGIGAITLFGPGY